VTCSRAGWLHCALGLLVGTVYPIAVWVALLASDQVSGVLYGCDATEMWVGVALQLIPFDIFLAIEAIILLPSIYVVVKSKSKIGGKKSLRKRWLSTVRVLCFLVYYLLALVFASVTKIYNSAHQSRIEQSIQDWVICSINGGDNCREENLYRLSFDYLMFQAGYVAINGIIVFLCFGTSQDACHWWKATVFRGKLHELLGWTLSKTASFTESSKTSKGSIPSTNSNSSQETPKPIEM